MNKIILITKEQNGGYYAIKGFTYQFDKHFTKEGHQALAEAILPKLEEIIRKGMPR